MFTDPKELQQEHFYDQIFENVEGLLQLFSKFVITCSFAMRSSV